MASVTAGSDETWNAVDVSISLTVILYSLSSP